MSRRANPPMPGASFSLLLVEGGDESAVSRALLPPTSTVCLWVARGRSDLPRLARLASLDPNFRFARRVAILLDTEEAISDAIAIAAAAYGALGSAAFPAHAMFSSDPVPIGVFVAPDGVSPGSIETLCRAAVTDVAVAACVDALVACGGTRQPTQALRDKAWMQAYLAMRKEPCRFHEAFGNPPAVEPGHAVFGPLRAFLAQL